MKLKLKESNGIAVLEMSGEASPHHIEVIRAGLRKLLSTGKNRIVFDITSAEKVTPALAEELIKFHTLAVELSGSIALVGKGDLIRDTARTSSVGVRYFATVDAALGSFRSDKGPSSLPMDGYKDLPLEAIKGLHVDLQARNQMLQDKMGTLGATDLKGMELENAILRKKIAHFQARLAELKKHAAQPAAASVFEQKIAKAEAYLEDFLKKEGLLQP